MATVEGLPGQQRRPGRVSYLLLCVMTPPPPGRPCCVPIPLMIIVAGLAPLLRYEFGQSRLGHMFSTTLIVLVWEKALPPSSRYTCFAKFCTTVFPINYAIPAPHAAVSSSPIELLRVGVWTKLLWSPDAALPFSQLDKPAYLQFYTQIHFWPC